jgi:hypothetical protein
VFHLRWFQREFQFFAFPLPKSLTLLPRRVNHKLPWPLGGGSAARLGSSAEPLCWSCPSQSASPLILLRSMASERSFAFHPGLLTVQQRQRRDHSQHASYYWVLLEESHLTGRLFGRMLRRIAALPSPAG